MFVTSETAKELTSSFRNLAAMKSPNPGRILVTCSCSYHFSRELMEEPLRPAIADGGRMLRVGGLRGHGITLRS
jgi:hypothetical protein